MAKLVELLGDALAHLHPHRGVADQDPVRRRPRRRPRHAPLRYLKGDPLGTPPGCARRSSHTSASVSAASRDAEVRGRRVASRNPSIPAAAYLAFQVYTD